MKGLEFQLKTYSYVAIVAINILIRAFVNLTLILI